MTQPALKWRAAALCLLIPLLTGCRDDSMFGSAIRTPEGTTGGTASEASSADSSLGAVSDSAAAAKLLVALPASTGGPAAFALGVATASAGAAGDPASSNGASPAVCTTLAVGVPRGVSCLHCMEPRARVAADSALEILRQSCLKNVALSYLVDGSFSFHPETLEAQVLALAESRRRVFLELYLTNGPSQRRWRSTPLRGLVNHMKPEKFRRAVVSDERVRAKISSRVRELVPTLRRLAEYDVQFLIVPMLEDNLTDEAFEQFVGLVLEALPADLAVQLGRSACPGCYPGNEDAAPPGVIREEHGLSADVADGIVSNDGFAYADLEEIRSLKNRALARNSLFLLWSAEAQGLAQGPQGLTGFTRASEQRVYRPYSADEIARTARFLAE